MVRRVSRYVFAYTAVHILESRKMRTYAPEKAPKAGIIDDTILLDVHNEELPQKKGQMRTRCSKGASRRREDGGLRPLCYERTL